MKRPARLVPGERVLVKGTNLPDGVYVLDAPVGADRRVKHVPVEARKLLEIGAGASELPDVRGAVVWAVPRADSTPEQMAAFVERLRAAGAARVVPLPLLAGSAPVPRASVASGKLSVGARAVVMALLDEVSEQADEVRMIVTRALDEAGL